MESSLRGDLAGHLLNVDDDELSRFQRSKADDDVDDAQIDVVLSGRRFIALHEVSIARRRPLKSALAEEVLHESSDVQANLRPERLVIRLEDDPLGPAIEALFKEEDQTPYGHVLVVVGELVGAAQGARAPHDSPGDGKGPQAVDGYGVEHSVFRIGQV